MFDKETLAISFDALLSHKLRTLLTMLGVIFGVGAVIAMLSIGEGAKQEALEQISILGINNIIVQAKVPDESMSSDIGIAKSAGLSIADGENILQFDALFKNFGFLSLIIARKFSFPILLSGSKMGCAINAPVL